jgi:hypothetical protein
MNDRLLEQMRRHLDERHQHLCQRLDDLEAAMRSLYGALTARLDQHEAYHRAQEHRWGLIRLAERHPFRLALLAVAGLALALGLAPGSEWLGQWARRLLLDMLG